MPTITREGATFSEQPKETIKKMVATGDTSGTQKTRLAELNKEFGGQANEVAKIYDR